MREIDKEATGQNIREFRELAELKQKDLAELAGMGVSTLQTLEYRGKGAAAWQSLFRLSDALGAYPEDLIVWKDE